MLVQINNRTKNKINIRLAERAVKKFLRLRHKNKCEVSIAFVGDKKITELNKQYRKINKTTDVLAFPGEEKFLGEIVINYSQVKRQAKKFGNNVEQELIYILVHGLLHLIGYNDRTEKGRKEMEKLGEEFIIKLH